MTADALSTANRRFWDELCGSDLARLVGIEDASPESLRAFDEAYFATYPYLLPLIESIGPDDAVAEVGLGYGSVAAALARRAGSYTGVDIAEGPVRFLRHRLDSEGIAAEAVNASALDLPLADASLDVLVAIGSLHHTGDLQRALDEATRVVRPGGRAIVMLYARWCWRTLSPIQIARYVKRLPSHGSFGAVLRSEYDANAAGDTAPHIDFVSRRDVRRMLGDWARIDITGRNLGTRRSPGVRLARRGVDSRWEHLLGQDLYIVATR